MVVIIKEEKNNLECKKNNESRHWKKYSRKQPFWRPIYEVIENSYFEETKLFPTTF